MTMRPRDPSDTDFPHGKATGYRLGCRASSPCPATPTCAEMRAAQVKKRRLERDAVPVYFSAAPLRKHLKKFLDRGWSISNIATAADIEWKTVQAIMKRRHSRVTGEVARKISDVSRDMLMTSKSATLPACEVAWLSGSLMAIGHSPQDQANLLGRHVCFIRDLITGRSVYVTREVYEDLLILHERLRDTSSISRHHRTHRRRAAELGFHAPDAYAPDGTLWEDDIRDERREERWARRDQESLLRMQVAHLSLTRHMGLYAITVHLGMDDEHGAGEQAVRRARAALGLKWTGGKAHGPQPGQEDRINEILKVVERWRLAGPLADPHPFCVELGMMDAPVWTSLDGKPKLEAA